MHGGRGGQVLGVALVHAIELAKPFPLAHPVKLSGDCNDLLPLDVVAEGAGPDEALPLGEATGPSRAERRGDLVELLFLGGGRGDLLERLAKRAERVALVNGQFRRAGRPGSRGVRGRSGQPGGLPPAARSRTSCA
jgi:hypothetical protein